MLEADGSQIWRAAWLRRFITNSRDSVTYDKLSNIVHSAELSGSGSGIQHFKKDTRCRYDQAAEDFLNETIDRYDRSEGLKKQLAESVWQYGRILDYRNVLLEIERAVKDKGRRLQLLMAFESALDADLKQMIDALGESEDREDRLAVERAAAEHDRRGAGGGAGARKLGGGDRAVAPRGGDGGRALPGIPRIRRDPVVPPPRPDDPPELKRARVDDPEYRGGGAGGARDDDAGFGVRGVRIRDDDLDRMRRDSMDGRGGFAYEGRYGGRDERRDGRRDR